jgi:hypothetical protein
MTTQNRGAVFDYRALRLLMGLIAFALPFVVWFLSASPLSSISASYYTDARDMFVGMLFVVSAFLWAYNGHSSNEARLSKVASLAAIFVAIFPTSCDLCETGGMASSIHYGAAATLFAVLAYFCFVPFRRNTKGQKGKKGRRSKIYFVCGWIMVGCILTVIVTKLTLSDETINALSLTFWAEAIALGAFGVAWIVAGKYLRPFVDEDEALRLFGQ